MRFFEFLAVLGSYKTAFSYRIATNGFIGRLKFSTLRLSWRGFLVPPIA